jgi:ABC-type amino acid transport substrate-binding protein
LQGPNIFLFATTCTPKRQKLRQGISERNLVRSCRGEVLVKRLERGCIQLLAYGKPVTRWYIRNAGIDNANVEVTYEFFAADLYYAFTRNVGDAVVDKLQKATHRIKSFPDE